MNKTVEIVNKYIDGDKNTLKSWARISTKREIVLAIAHYHAITQKLDIVADIYHAFD